MKYIFLLLLFCVFYCEKHTEEKIIENSTHTKSSPKTILFFGDSLTAGMGLDSQEDSFVGIIQKKLDKEDFRYIAINSGLSGDTTSGGISRLDWALSKKPDIFVLELGANDSMRGISPSQIKSNLIQIIQMVKRRYPDCKILLLGMKTFPNLGPIYARKFEKIFPEIQIEENIILVPFLLEKIAGENSLNQLDGIHPTEEGHKIMADTVYKYLRPMLKR
ncbi:MAG: arylesterase [Leptospiraceae bacterium]|nr:arylesterase [Leptospiraceae bacterium]MCK6380244.1 arylesterase [Leptospiraceae bacterium]NUM42551.1 arylesterase [Leptospiraceae bacterium]